MQKSGSRCKTVAPSEHFVKQAGGELKVLTRRLTNGSSGDLERRPRCSPAHSYESGAIRHARPQHRSLNQSTRSHKRDGSSPH
jgi:hypothetical protein